MTKHRNIGAAILIAAAGLAGACNHVSGQDQPKMPPASAANLATQIADMSAALESFENDRRALEERAVSLKVELAALQDKRTELLERQDQLGISNASYGDILKLLQSQKVQLAVDLAGLDARRDALMTQPEASHPGGDKSGMVEATLNDLLAIQRERLRQVEALHDRGSAPDSEVLSAKQQLLEVQLRMAELSNSHGRNEAIDAELIGVSLSRAETLARLQKVEQLLAEYSRARSTVDSLDRVQSEIGTMEAAWREAVANAVKFELQRNAYKAQRKWLGVETKQADTNPPEKDR